MNKRDINLEDILTDKVVEEDLLEVPLGDRVFKSFFVLVLFLILVVIGQLVNLGVFNNSFYTSRSLANISYAEVEPAPRGVIVDRFGIPLIRNEQTLNTFLVPHELPKNLDDRLSVFRRINEILGIDQRELDQRIKEKDWGSSEKLFLTGDLDHNQIAILESDNVPGLRVEQSFKRVHELSLTFSHLLGFTGLVSVHDLKQSPGLFIDDEIGKAGLEAYYDASLRGVNGREIFLRDAVGKIKEKRVSALSQVGGKLETFIDREFQEYFYNRLMQALSELDRNIGVGIAINPQNGEVLALFSIPGFDANNVAGFLESNNQPFFNRAVSGLYAPGSTIKPLVATAALVEGVVNPGTEIFSAGFIEIPNPYSPDSPPSLFLDWRPHGWVDLHSALARSSNVYFYEVGGGFKNQQGLGITKLKDWWQKFNLGGKTEIDLPGEVPGFLPDPYWKNEQGETWRLGDTYNVSIGQGDLLVTPITLLNYISAIATGGEFYQLRIMKSVIDREGEEIIRSKPTVLKDISQGIGGYVKEVQQGMRDAVVRPYGTANLLSGLPVSVAAKTGTSQVNNNEKVNAFFVGYAPYDPLAGEPQIAILVLVEDAREGSLNVVPVARDVFSWYYENRIKLR
ncbi:MAG: penicillin-binding transpeptidase domain-containing protein [Patescibacteria group bacterium]|nr:penicillin-binding transpeptidase domain-containing protein [Patescibacteria group bacterium]